MRVPYSYLEIESIDNDYDQQVPISIIAENVNKSFHNGKPIRTTTAISKVIYKINNDNEWYSRLEEKWLNSIEIAP